MSKRKPKGNINRLQANNENAQKPAVGCVFINTKATVNNPVNRSSGRNLVWVKKECLRLKK